jgi:hypothetical protein
MRALVGSMLSLTLLAAPLAAGADPLVAAGGKPGVAKSWTAKGDTATLVLAEGFVPADVAAAIEKGVAGTTAKAQGNNKVVVSGKPLPELLGALEKVDVSPPLDDVNQMFAALQGAGGGGGEGEGSGSSIRATSDADFSAVIEDRTASAEATVVEVKHGDYPFVAITVSLVSVPKAAANWLKKGEKVTVVPRINAVRGVIAKGDEQSKINVGAWYAKKGDKVSLKLEGKTKQGFWVAERFERMR